MTPEKRVQNKILRYLNNLVDEGKPLFVERRQAGGFSYKKGLPDVYCVYKGQHIEIEVKRPGGELSSMQIKYKQLFENIGVKYICADSLDDVKQLLESI